MIRSNIVPAGASGVTFVSPTSESATTSSATIVFNDDVKYASLYLHGAGSTYGAILFVDIENNTVSHNGAPNDVISGTPTFTYDGTTHTVTVSYTLATGITSVYSRAYGLS